MQLCQAATRGSYRPTPQHLSAALLSARAGPLWDASLELAASPADQQPQQQSDAGIAWRNMCAALLVACQLQLAPQPAAGSGLPAGMEWAGQLSLDAQLLLLRVLCQLGRADDFVQLCLALELRHAPEASRGSNELLCQHPTWICYAVTDRVLPGN
jgi:hypothetical protein